MEFMVIRAISQEISKTIILTTIKQTCDIWDIRTKDMEIFITVSLVTLIIQIRVNSTRLAGIPRITNSVTPREIKGTMQIPFRRQSHGLSTNSELLVSTELKISLPD